MNTIYSLLRGQALQAHTPHRSVWLNMVEGYIQQWVEEAWMNIRINAPFTTTFLISDWLYIRTLLYIYFTHSNYFSHTQTAFMNRMRVKNCLHNHVLLCGL